MALSNASSQTLSAPGSPVGPLGAVPTWCPSINPNPEWLHLDGVAGMEHLVESARARFGPAGHEYAAGPALGGGEATPPGSPRPDTGPAPRQETWSVAYGNPPPWLPPASGSNLPYHVPNLSVGIPDDELYALRCGTPPGMESFPAPRVGAYRPHFMEPLTNGSSAVASPVDRGSAAGGAPPDHIAAVMLRDYYPGLVAEPPGPAVPFVPLPSILTDPITQEELDGSATPPGMPSFPAPRIGPKSEDHAE
jgi:hypothetical protein